MTAYRVIDDHKELENVGSLTHDQLDSHVSSTPFLIVSGVVGPIPPSARLLSGSGITITDGGPGGTLTLTVTGGSGGSGTPGGNDAEVQFNDGGSFGGDPNFTFDKTTATLTVNNLSGSLTKLPDGSSYLVAGSNISILTGSSGQITISSTATGGGSGDPNATYLVLSTTGSLSNERAFAASTGILTNDGGPGGSYTVSIDNSVVATLTGSIFSGPVSFNGGLSGSLTRLADGSSYIKAGANVSIFTSSNGSITVTAAAGTGAPQGPDGSVQFNDGGYFNGESEFSYNKTSNSLTVTNLSGSLTKLSDGTSYLIAGSNISITSASNGSVVISTTDANTLTTWMETPVGDADGVNIVFMLANNPYPTDSLWLYVNGALQAQGASNDYTISNNQIIMNSSPTSGSSLLATYSYVDTNVYGSYTKWSDYVSGATDGINTTFTLTYVPNPVSSLMFYVNGILQRPGVSNDYTISGNTITTTVPPGVNSTLLASYRYTFSPPAGTTTSWMEIPSGFVDGANFQFTISNSPLPSNALMFFVNGVLQRQGISSDYTVSSNVITMNYTPNSGSSVIATYPY